MGWTVSAALALPAATGPRTDPSVEGLVVVDPRLGTVRTGPFDGLPALLGPGDLLVLNDAGTLPASLTGLSAAGPVELRLVEDLGSDRWRVAVLGAGDWRTPTERRSEPPALTVGATVGVRPWLRARVLTVEDRRRLTVRFETDGRPVLRALLQAGEPVRYSYLREPVPLAAFQTPFAGRPVASEMPSAGRPLRWSILLGLRRKGVGIATLTHAAGLSSVDGGVVDATLPWPERAVIPEATVAAVAATRARAGRVVAVGTTVVRALEGAALDGTLRAGEHRVDLVLGPETRRRVVDGVLTNLHAPGESHFALLSGFAPPRLLEAALEEAVRRGFVAHEFGDSALLLPSSGGRAGAGSRGGPS